MRNKFPADLVVLLKPTLSLILISLGGCSATPQTASKQAAIIDPSTGGLLQTIHALKSGLYERQLQLQKTELRHWQTANNQQQAASHQLKAKKAQTDRELATLTQTTHHNSKRIESSQQFLQALSQQHAKLVADIKALEYATQQLAHKTQKQAVQQAAEQQHLGALVAERDRLRQALSMLIQSDGSPSE